jgi:predicted GIY-YIG superfamily endonuclease
MKGVGNEAMRRKRTTARYELLDQREIVYVGITERLLQERAGEHQRDGKDFTRIRQVGPRVTKESALQWEQERLNAYKRSHGGNAPREQG